MKIRSPLSVFRFRGACLATILLASSVIPLQAQTSPRIDTSGAYVRVSRDEVRVYFAPETSDAWGVPATVALYDGTLLWNALLEGVNGTASLRLLFPPDTDAGTTPSLETVVRVGHLDFCRTDIVGGSCSGSQVTARIENRRIVLGYRDTFEIRRIFGLRPATVPILKLRPSYLGDSDFADAPVIYVDPQIVVDSALRVALAQRRRQREASINRYYRSIAGSRALPLWLAVGDSTALGVQESRCQIDLCGGYEPLDGGPPEWGRWSLSDSSIATLHRVPPSDVYNQYGYDEYPLRMLVAKRPGRVTVRATGVHTSADTMPSATALDSIVEGEVLVTRPVSRVVLSPRPASMTAGTPLSFRVRVLDRSGRTIDGPPVGIKWDTNAAYATSASDSVIVTFTQPGRHWVAASLGAYTDSVSVDVRGPAAPP